MRTVAAVAVLAGALLAGCSEHWPQPDPLGPGAPTIREAAEDVVKAAEVGDMDAVHDVSCREPDIFDGDGVAVLQGARPSAHAQSVRRIGPKKWSVTVSTNLPVAAQANTIIVVRIANAYYACTPNERHRCRAPDRSPRRLKPPRVQARRHLERTGVADRAIMNG